MNYLNDGRFDGELGNGVSSGCCEVDFGDGSTSIEDAMKVLLQGLGEDINREGIRKTPFRVAKALREGTRGELSSTTFFTGMIFNLLFGFSYRYH
ncbi:GTP cyclohydrolase [Arachis hypogaea]|nr:GTP cyclohydrolase [Arachis hypogaea]